MFRRFPLFHRLNTSSRRFAVVPRDSMAFYRYDWNSLVAEDPEQRALVPEFMDGLHYFPRRDEMADSADGVRRARRRRSALRLPLGVDAPGGRPLRPRHDRRRVPLRHRRLRRRDVRAVAPADTRPRARAALRRPERPRRRVVPGQAGLHHRQAQLGLRDRRRAAALGGPDRARLAAPRPPLDRHRRADAAAGALPRGVRGPLLRRRQLRRRLRDRADRAQRRRAGACTRRGRRSRGRWSSTSTR